MTLSATHFSRGRRTLFAMPHCSGPRGFSTSFSPVHIISGLRLFPVFHSPLSSGRFGSLSLWWAPRAVLKRKNPTVAACHVGNETVVPSHEWSLLNSLGFHFRRFLHSFFSRLCWWYRNLASKHLPYKGKTEISVSIFSRNRKIFFIRQHLLKVSFKFCFFLFLMFESDRHLVFMSVQSYSRQKFYHQNWSKFVIVGYVGHAPHSESPRGPRLSLRLCINIFLLACF